MLSPDLVRSVLDSAPDAMVVIDQSGSILFVNRQVSALFGYEPDEIKGRKMECLLPARFRDRHVVHRQHYADNVRVRPMGVGLDLFAVCKDGTEFPVEISLSPIADGATMLVAAAIRDATERRQAQLEIKAAQQLAESANQAKSRFLATASHDLRQPLQTIALLNGAMRRMVSDCDLAEALSQQDQAIGAMSRLLNALLDISKLESGAIKPQIADFSISSLLDELRNDFAPYAAEKGLSLKVEGCADCVHSDSSLLGQVLRNLVSNAIKYTREGCVHVRCLRDHACIRLEVLDTGIGIPAGELPRIYEEFYQIAIPSPASREGYGLGLAIVSRIVQLLGLKLDVHSEVGRGSTFALELPAGSIQLDTHRGTSGSETRAKPKSRPPHILLVEDDAAVLNATRMLFTVEGYKVSTAASVREALRQAIDHSDIKLLVTDYHLAGNETGLQVISSVREVLGSDLGAVLITGDTSSAVQDLKHCGPVRVTRKPIDADELLSTMRALLTP